MTTFATADDLAARLGLTLTSDEQTRAGTLLDIASGLIQAETRQIIGQVVDDVLTMPGTVDEVINLPERPVTAVSSVTLDGRALDADGYWYLDGNAIRRRPALMSQSYGRADFGSGGMEWPFFYPVGFGWPTQTLEITYTHGYTTDTMPALVKTICLEVVVRIWVNPGAVINDAVAGTQTTYAARGLRGSAGLGGIGMLLTDGERLAIQRFFGYRAQSVTVGG